MWTSSAQSAAQLNTTASVLLIIFAALSVCASIVALISNSEMQRYAETEKKRIKADAAEAKRHAAELKLETEQLREKVTWRRLTPEQVSLIGQLFRGFPFAITVADIQGDPESTAYGEDVAAALKRAGITVEQEDLVTAGGPPSMGLVVTRTPDGNGEKVTTLLTQAGVSVAGRSDSASLAIIVGTKPHTVAK